MVRRGATGRRAIPAGVTAMVTAMALDGHKKAEIARQCGVSADYVEKIAATLKQRDPALMATIRKHLPDEMTTLAAMHAVTAQAYVEAGDTKKAVAATFGAKLALEANRHASPQSEAAGASVLNLIAALSQAGGGSLTVGPTPVDVIDVTPTASESA
jgi:hypothetical protein